MFLSTAIVHVVDSQGRRHECRALLDQGSQVNILKEGFARRVGLQREPSRTVISGVGATGSKGCVRGRTQIRIAARCSGYQCNLPCLVLPRLTTDIPNFELTSTSLPIPSHLILADPQYHVSRDVDLIIGNGYLWELMCVGQHRLGAKLPVLLKTRLGWVLAGRIRADTETQERACHVVTNEQLRDQVARFWEVEAVPVSKESAHHPCEERFLQTVTRNTEGRYCVTIPFNNKLDSLGDSRSMAERRFFSMEKRLSRSPDLRSAYTQFMRDYIDLGHMSKVSHDACQRATASYYLPHHAIVKEMSTTTKVRVVFDGSAKSTSGVSINDAQLVGPVVQDDLFSILTRFRQYPVVLSADIEKMYRQVLIAPEQRTFQRILWREDPSHPLETFELNTVTYGTAAASYLATRTLRQVGLEARDSFPVANRVITSDFYVDDLLTGAETATEAREIKRDVEAILRQSGFVLRYWASNKATTLREGSETMIPITPEAERDPNTLGLSWNPSADVLQFHVNTTITTRVTKRLILSQLARIFDPLGLVAPITISAKLLMQTRWRLELSWDESVPQHIFTEFCNFQSDVRSLGQVSIPRWVSTRKSARIEIHGFCDASEKAYGACVYMRTTDSSGGTKVSLLCSKSRVAPLKRISLPRLELCGAVLLIQLISKTRAASRLVIDKETYWTDSTIVLAWVHGSPDRWKTFVANRVTEIQALSRGEWHHVVSAENPADILSRGMSASALQNSDLWWTGPAWLNRARDTWPTNRPPPAAISEERAVVYTAVEARDEPDFAALRRYSSYSRLLRVIAYCLRFYNALSRRITHKRLHGDPLLATLPADPEQGLSISELNAAETAIVKIVQRQAFKQEIADLQEDKGVPTTSIVRSLNPLLDAQGVLRVGGRLAFAGLKSSPRALTSPS